MLDNGLQALLISDYSGPAASEDDDSDAEEEEEEEEDESGDETEDESEQDDDIEEGSDEDDDEGKKKKGNAEKQVLSDQYHEYQYHQMYPFCPLSDGNLALICVQSAAALCVGVGSFSDPGDLPGLAHFLEHSE